MGGQHFEPSITGADDGVLSIKVGLIHLEDEEPELVEHFEVPDCKLPALQRVQAALTVWGADRQCGQGR